MDNLTETKLTSEKIYSGCILDFYRDTVRLPNGGTAPRELSRHVGAVCIVPLLDDGRVIVERQFRYPVNEVITEIPAGKRDSRDEAPDDAARRELREETGITARELIPLGPFYPAAAYSDEVIWMYLARGLTFGEQQLDDDEFLNLQAVPLDELARDFMNIELQRICLSRNATAFLITHSIPEAVYLSTKIVVMSPRPGRITDVIESPLPRERPLDIRDTPEFIAIAHRVREGLRAGHAHD